MTDQSPQGWEPRSRNGQQAPQNKNNRKRNIWIGVGGLVALFAVAGITGANSSKKPATTSQSQTISVVTSAKASAKESSDTSYTTIPLNPMPTSAAPSPQGPDNEVVFKCSGNAPDGVDITYGTDSSNASASKLPFSHTETLDSSAEYYEVQAQLSGSGHVTCSTTVYWSGQSATKSGTAEGGYNIAATEICSTFDGGWEGC